MIFNNYKDLVNYVLRHYPYEKILSYNRNLNYPCKCWRYGKPNFLTKTDIKKQLVLILSNLCEADLATKTIEEIPESRRVSLLYQNYRYLIWNVYFRVRFSGDRTKLIISYKYEFSGRFSKYTLPHHFYKFGDKRTEVIFKFKDNEQIL